MWIRLDTGITHHDKTLRLLQQADGWQAIGVYVFGLAWCGAQGTDGHIPAHALPALHASEAVVALLVDARLWESAPDGGWIIRNWDKRQDTQARLDDRRRTAHAKALKASCVRWHGSDCNCWQGA